VTTFGSARRDLTIGACCLLLASCGGSSGGGNNAPVTDTGLIRIVNSVPDSPTLNAGVTAATLTRVSFAQSTKLTQLFVGSYSLNVQYIDSAGSVVNVITNEPLKLDADIEVSVFVIGDLATAHSQLIVNPVPVIAAGKAEFQVMQASANAGTVDVYLTNAAAPLAGATPLHLAFEAASDLLTIDATIDASTKYRLRVTTAGTPTVLYDSGPFAIASESRPMFVLEDYFGPGGQGVRAVQLTNEAATTFPAEVLPGAIRIANMIADPAVDVYVAGIKTFPGVAFDAITARQEFTAGALDVTVTNAGDASTVLLTGTVTLGSGESRTLVLSRSGVGVAGRFSLDNTRPISGATQLQVVQAAPSTGNIDVYLLTGGKTTADVSPTFVNLPLQSITSGAPAPETYDIAVTPTGVKTVAAETLGREMQACGIYSVYVSDAAVPGGGSPPQIVLGDDFGALASCPP